MRTVLTLMAAAVVIYLAACAALFVFQRSLLYFPQPSSAAADAPMLRLPVDGGDVLVSALPRAGPGAAIYFGGNAEDVSRSLPMLAQAFPDRALYLLHYRGYGGSTGTPSEAAIHADALALFDRVKAEHEDVAVVGRSLGTGVGVRLAVERPVSRLILVTPYDSLQDIAARQFPIFPVRWLMLDKFDAGRHAPRITVPTTLVVAENDEIIPRASSEQLYRRFAPGVATLKVIPGTGHNTIDGSPAYLPALSGR